MTQPRAHLQSLAFNEVAAILSKRPKVLSLQTRRVPLPVGERPALLINDAYYVAVHAKEYVSLYRKTATLQHGIREDLLKHYAALDFFLCIYEADSGTALMAPAKLCLAQSPVYSMFGEIEGPDEVSRFIPRSIFQFLNRPHNSPPNVIR